MKKMTRRKKDARVEIPASTVGGWPPRMKIPNDAKHPRIAGDARVYKYPGTEIEMISPTRT